MAACSELAASFPSAVRRIDSVCRWLGDAVAPVLALLEERAPKRLAVVACGGFSRLPVHAGWILADGRRRYPLVEFGCSYIPNLVLRALENLPTAPLSSDVLVVGPPRDVTHDLAQAALEARDVRNRWASARLVWSKDEVMTALPTSTLVHFCTHGVRIRSNR
jgi:CHAT domain-containing protein